MLDQRLKRCRNQAVIMVTHFSIAGNDAVSVNPALRCRRVVLARLFASAAAAGVPVRADVTGSAGVLPGTVRRHAAVVVVVVLRGGGGGGGGVGRREGGAAVRAVRLGDVVGVLGRHVRAVVDVFLGGFGRRVAAVRAARLRMVVVAAVRAAGVELSGVRSGGRHDDLWET